MNAFAKVGFGVMTLSVGRGKELLERRSSQNEGDIVLASPTCLLIHRTLFRNIHVDIILIVGNGFHAEST